MSGEQFDSGTGADQQGGMIAETSEELIGQTDSCRSDGYGARADFSIGAYFLGYGEGVLHKSA